MSFVFRLMNYITAKTAVYVEYLHRQYYIYKKISKIHKRACHGKRPENSLKLYKKQWSVLSRFVPSKYYEVYSSISGKDDINYVPENIFYSIIEPTLNDNSLSKAYVDKNFYDRLPFSNLFPKTFMRNIDGTFYDSKYDCIASFSNSELLSTLDKFHAPKVIVKPSVDSMGGRRVQLFTKNKEGYKNHNGHSLCVDYLQKYFLKDYLIQEFIQQHEFYRQFNPSSLNTIRVFTYRSVKTEEVIVLHAVQRMGRKGSITDNQSGGGISCGINNGRLNNFAVDKKGNMYTHIDEEKSLSFECVKDVYKYDEIIRKAQEVARHFYYHRILSCDFCVDENDTIRLVEINNEDMEINFLQMNNGPLFGEYTDEVIEYCRNNPTRTRLKVLYY